MHEKLRQKIKTIKYEQLLGVHIRNNLSWSIHVDSIFKKVKAKLYLHTRIISFVSYVVRRQFLI